MILASASMRPSESKPTSHVDHLDMLRGCAAAIVVATHLRSYLFADYFSLKSPDVFTKLFYGVTGLGPDAVIVFFALSGYLVGGQALSLMIEKRWQWRRYLLRRITRLWVVVIPALLLTLGLDFIGEALTGGAGYDGSFRGLYPSSSYFVSRPDHSIATFLGNLAFLQTIYVPVYGTNGPLWSLANEFSYYIAVPAAAALVLVPSGFALRAALFGILVLILAILPAAIIVLGSIWIAGAAARWIADNPRLAKVLEHRTITAVILGIACLGVVYAKTEGGRKENLILGFAVSCGLPFIAHLPRAGRLYRLAGESLAKISYSLYLTHFPFLTLIVLVGIAPYRRHLAPSGLMLYFAILAVTVAWSVLIWWCFERHTDRIFKYLDAFTAKRPGRAAGR